MKLQVPWRIEQTSLTPDRNVNRRRPSSAKEGNTDVLPNLLAVASRQSGTSYPLVTAWTFFARLAHCSEQSATSLHQY